MLKVRLMGTKNDIKWFGKILQRHPKIEVTELSVLCGIIWRIQENDKDSNGQIGEVTGNKERISYSQLWRRTCLQ